MSAISAAGERVPAWLVARRRPGSLDLVETLVLTLFVLVAVWVLGIDLYRVIADGGVWTGTDGIFSEDQLQYLGWIRAASRQVLASNLFVVGPTPADYLQPMVAISGGLVALGMAPWLALLVWKPVALVALVIAVRTLVHRAVPGPGARRAALAVALFGGGVGMFVDFWLPFWTWGYPFALAALAAALATLLSYQRARETGRLPLTAAAFGLLASWLHPWQGETLLLILAGSEVVMCALGQRPRAIPLLGVGTAIALPLVYYAALSRADRSWHLARLAGGAGYPLWPLLLAMAPLELAALPALRLRPQTFTDAALRIWPLAAVAAFLVDEHGLGSGPFHVFLGISVPLAVLAVQGAVNIPVPARTPRAALALLAVLALTVPAGVDQISYAARYVLPHHDQANFIGLAEQRALAYVADQPGPGAVLAAFHVGELVPAETGRPTYLGSPFWSQPDFFQRNLLTEFLLLRWLSPGKARAFVLSTGARYLITGCAVHRSLRGLLGPIVESVHAAGCGRVYTIRTVWPRPAPPSIPLREVSYLG